MGVGSVLRSDDAAGMYLIELLRKKIRRDDVLLIAGSNAPENFTGVIKNFAPDKLLIVDAAHMGFLPGEMKIVPAASIGGVSVSTHMLPLSIMLDYLKTEAGCEVLLIGVQPRSTEQGLGMSAEVKSGVRQLAECFGDAFSAL